MMKITIQELDLSNLHFVNQCDNRFWVKSILRLNAEDERISYTITPVQEYEKRYPLETIDPKAYLQHPERAIFFAFADGQPSGQIILRKNWNQYAYIEDIVVDAKFRRQGIGTALLSRAAAWARSINLPGLMLETQNNNVAACQLYASFGFQLAGFDRLLYQGLHPDTDEIALYWYLAF